MKKEIAIPIAVMGVLLFGLLVGTPKSVPQQAKQPPHTQTSAMDKEKKAALQAALQQKQQEQFEEQLRDGLVRRGKGIETSYQNQMNRHPENYEFPGGALTTTKWAGRQAHLVAKALGDVEGIFGGEMRVLHADQYSYVLNRTKGAWEAMLYRVTVDQRTHKITVVKKIQTITVKDHHEDMFRGWPGQEQYLTSVEYRWPQSGTSGTLG